MHQQMWDNVILHNATGGLVSERVCWACAGAEDNACKFRYSRLLWRELSHFCRHAFCRSFPVTSPCFRESEWNSFGKARSRAAACNIRSRIRHRVLRRIHRVWRFGERRWPISGAKQEPAGAVCGRDYYSFWFAPGGLADQYPGAGGNHRRYLLVVAGVALWMSTGTEDSIWFNPAQFISVSIIFLAGPSLTRWLNRDIHFRNLGGSDAQNRGAGPFAGVASGFLLGFAFAFGWTPCIGPILAGVLAMAATSDTITQGVFLLAVYSAGLAIPFLLTALGINQFLGFYQRFRRYLQAVEVASGALLLVVGGLIFANRLTWLSGKLGFLNRFVK